MGLSFRSLCIVFIMFFYSVSTIAIDDLNDYMTFSLSEGEMPDIEFKLIGEDFFNDKVDFLSSENNDLFVDGSLFGEIVSLLKKHVSANRGDIIAEILANWSDDDVDQIRSLFEDEEIKERNRSNFDSLKSMQLNLVFRYKEYYVAIVNHDFVNTDFILHYTMIKKDDGFLLTNALGNDIQFNKLVDILYQLNESNIVID